MAACVFRCCVVFAFLALTNVLLTEATLTTEDNPAYKTIFEGVPAFEVQLGTAVNAHGIRVRRDVNDTVEQTTTAAPLDETTTRTVSSTTAAKTTTTTTATTTTKSGSMCSLQETNHTYYKSRRVTGKEARKYFVNYEEMKKHGLITHVKLSASHRTAASISTTFTFPFYGHDVTKVTIATGGFLYMSDFLHQWLTATQYIAPLMANFDTTIGNHSLIHYADNGTSLIVMWENVHLQDDEEAGPFTFEVILHMDGTIIFSYYQIPKAVSSIRASAHPVKVGLSDAYYFDRQTSNGRVKQRTIYEYHRVRINVTGIADHTAFIITPLPTCNIYKSCPDCLVEGATYSFNCMWCPKVSRCSSGLDRQRQEWLYHNCHQVDINVGECDAFSSLHDRSGRFNVGILFAVFMLLIVVGALIGWVVYAYRNPNTRSGQWLIEHRPSRLKEQLAKVKFWKRGDESSGERYAVSVGGVGSTTA
ncbi:hypothetical protein NP493_285g00000 [Ridgeia piscesae]|uniref:PSI domain-containing protein n=1 Tax=Ridgeia piscesae TaxID=27915 RepID=A0AAD9NX13_RIDPI|nr:hypothetical protein NP493_285g00000 [Ridgeia piscesae]